MWGDNRGRTFSLWIMKYFYEYFTQNKGLKLNALMVDTFLKNTQLFSSQDIN